MPGIETVGDDLTARSRSPPNVLDAAALSDGKKASMASCQAAGKPLGLTSGGGESRIAGGTGKPARHILTSDAPFPPSSAPRSPDSRGSGALSTPMPYRRPSLFGDRRGRRPRF